MDQKIFLSLIDKYLEGKASEAEKRLLEEYYHRLDTPKDSAMSPGQLELLKEDMLQNIRQGMSTEPGDRKSRRTKRVTFGSLAALIVILSAGLYYYADRQPVRLVEKKHTIQDQDVPPGGNKAVLTLGDGSKISLDDSGSGIIAKESGISISKTPDGQLIYTVNNAEPANENEPVAYNTIETPKGGQYQLILPDGTRVWINAASSLKFPAAFAASGRKVELSGEAYFEVEPDKHKPFRIETGSQTIEVLGTHFNVNAYPDEPSINTTLLEGSVRIAENRTHKSQILKPGEQGRTDRNGSISVHQANMEQAVSWKNGNFLFNDAELVNIMRQLERWYDVRVDYSHIPDTRYNAHISRNLSLSKILEVLEVTGGINFEIKDKTIKISTYK